MEESQRNLNEAISKMAESLHRNHLRQVYAESFSCCHRCTEDPSLDPLKFQECVERCSSKITQVDKLMSNEMEHIQDRLMRCIRSCEDKVKDSGKKDEQQMKAIFEPCVVDCAKHTLQLLPKFESRIVDKLKRF